MTAHVLDVDPTKCTGCRDCEVACSEKHTLENNPDLSRIHILDLDNGNDFHLPTTCQHCEDPPCRAACTENAIYLDPVLGRVLIDQDLCIGCKMCYSACPTGAMGFDDVRGRAFKCDLCGGNPECVRVCEPKALSYSEPHKLQYPRMCESASKLCGLIGRKAA
jgi:Fe-S-cluster-containing hydrogenase component 2